MTAPVTRSDYAMVVDEKNLVRMWLERKIARHELTPKQADEMLEDYEAKGKLWVGPAKDSYGAASIVRLLSRELNSWYGGRVLIKATKKGEVAIFKGRAGLRTYLTGTRYGLTHEKIVHLQIGKHGLREGAKESARFGVILVCAVDVADYFLRDDATFGSLLGSLTVDIPSVLVASAIGSVVAEAAAGSAMIGAIACGPLVLGILVAAGVGYGLYLLDEKFGLTKKLSHVYDQAIAKLDAVAAELGATAEQRWRQLERSRMIHDLSRETHELAARLGREADWVRLHWFGA